MPVEQCGEEADDEDVHEHREVSCRFERKASLMGPFDSEDCDGFVEFHRGVMLICRSRRAPGLYRYEDSAGDGGGRRDVGLGGLVTCGRSIRAWMAGKE